MVSRARPAWLRPLVANSSISPGPTGYAYGGHAVPERRRLIGKCLALLLPRPLVRAPAAPSVLETTVVRQGAITIVHLLSFAPERRGELDIVEDALPLVGLPISIRTDRPPKRVQPAPRRTAGPRVPRRLRHGARHPARRPRHAGVPMITTRSDWWNADSYYPWIDLLVQAAFGAEIDLLGDLIPAAPPRPDRRPCSGLAARP